MSKTVLITSLTAACWLAAAAPQIVNDSPGVTVSMNGATVLHRTAVRYPPAALEAGVQGMVSIEVKLDAEGMVSDAQVLSGPDELRKTALASVLEWHFTRDLAGVTRVIQIAFEPPKTEAAQPAAAAPPGATMRLIPVGHINSIKVSGLSDEAGKQLLASLPVHEGDEWNADAMQNVNRAVKAFDEHLGIRVASTTQKPNGVPELALVIDAVAAPGTIKVGGNVQATKILTKVAPIYPAEAKANGISGTVQLSVFIGQDGTVQQLAVLSGPPELTQASLDAVKQWVYQPTLLNGNPVQVETTITVNFTLSQ